MLTSSEFDDAVGKLSNVQTLVLGQTANNQRPRTTPIYSWLTSSLHQPTR